MSAGARRIEKRVPDGLAAPFFSRGADAVIGGPEWAIRACGNLSWRDWQCPRGIGGCDCSCMSAPARVFLKFSRIAPGLQSDAETDGLHVARLFYAHNEKARGHGARRSGVSRVLSEPGGLRVPQQQTDAGWRTGAGCGDISRETATTPAQWKAKAAREVHLRRAESLLRRRPRRLRAARQENSCK